MDNNLLGFEILLSTLSSTQSFFDPVSKEFGTSSIFIPLPKSFICLDHYRHLPLSLDYKKKKKSFSLLGILILTKKRFKLARYFLPKYAFVTPSPTTSQQAPTWSVLNGDDSCFLWWRSGGGLAHQVCVTIQGFGHQLGWLKVRV